MRVSMRFAATHEFGILAHSGHRPESRMGGGKGPVGGGAGAI